MCIAKGKTEIQISPTHQMLRKRTEERKKQDSSSKHKLRRNNCQSIEN
jgi:hypothetical protein